MQCRTHPTKPAANTCNHCGNWLCDECTVDVQGRLFCRPCLTVLSQCSTEASTAHKDTASPCRKIGFGTLLFFSFFPSGANYMCMGLMKRGLATMAGFFLLIFLFSSSSMPMTLLLIFAFVVLVIASFIDGFNVRNRINAGEHVRDDLGEVLNTIIANKFLRTTILVVVAIVLVSQALGFAFSLIGTLMPWLVIGFIVLVIMKKRKPPVS